MIAKALESNGATVYIIGRRLAVLEEAAKEHSVRWFTRTSYWQLLTTVNLTRPGERLSLSKGTLHPKILSYQ